MNASWRLIDSGLCDAVYNMALDEAIAIAVRRGESPPALRLYGWEGLAVSLGSFQKITDIDSQYCINNNIPIVRRPTGGRGILHGDEFTYSFSSRNEGDFSAGLLETYRKLSAAFQSALNKMGLSVTMKREREAGGNITRSPLCFKSTSYGEISFDGSKLIGSAQKRWSDGFLQQGSIPYSIDYEKLRTVFGIGQQSSVGSKKDSRQSAVGSREKTGDWRQGTGDCLVMAGLKDLLPDFNPEKFKQCIKSSFEEDFNITLVDSQPSPQEQELAHLLCAEKYQNLRWTQGMARNIRFCSNNEISKRAL